MTMKQRRTKTNVLESIGLEILKADPAERLADPGLKIEYIPAEPFRPDSTCMGEKPYPRCRQAVKPLDESNRGTVLPRHHADQ
jgi:hypothetical protein